MGSIHRGVHIVLVALVGLAVTGCDSDPSAFGECHEVMETFEPCGGDPRGMWSVDRTCHAPQAAPAPMLQACAAAKGETLFDLEASVDIDDTTVRYGHGRLRTSAEVYFPESCVSSRWERSCSGITKEFGSSWDWISCTERSGGCQCGFDLLLDIEPSQERYRMERGLLVNLDDVEAPARPYCVRDDEMALELEISKNVLWYLVFQRR